MQTLHLVSSVVFYGNLSIMWLMIQKPHLLHVQSRVIVIE